MLSLLMKRHLVKHKVLFLILKNKLNYAVWNKTCSLSADKKLLSLLRNIKLWVAWTDYYDIVVRILAIWILTYISINKKTQNYLIPKRLNNEKIAQKAFLTFYVCESTIDMFLNLGISPSSTDFCIKLYQTLLTMKIEINRMIKWI